MGIENKAIVIFIPIRIIAVDLQDFGNEAPARAAFEMHNDVYGVADVCLDRAIGQVHATLQHAACESG